jgi:hypothetical protein
MCGDEPILSYFDEEVDIEVSGQNYKKNSNLLWGKNYPILVFGGDEVLFSVVLSTCSASQPTPKAAKKNGRDHPHEGERADLV